MQEIFFLVYWRNLEISLYIVNILNGTSKPRTINQEVFCVCKASFLARALSLCGVSLSPTCEELSLLLLSFYLYFTIERYLFKR